MTSDVFFIGFAFMLAGILAGRFISENALKKLSDDEKLLLLNKFAGQRKRSILIVLAGVGVFFSIVKLEILSAHNSLVLYCIAILAYFITNIILTYFKLTKLPISDAYLKGYLWSSAVRIIGVLGLMVVTIWY